MTASSRVISIALSRGGMPVPWIGGDLPPGRHRPRAELGPLQREPEHRQQRQEEEQPEHREDQIAEHVQPPASASLHAARAPGRRGGGRLAECGYRSHRAALRCSNAYPVMTMATSDHHAQGEQVGHVDVAQPDLAGQRGADLLRHDVGDLVLPGTDGREGRQRVREQQQRGAEEGRRQQRAADVPPVLPRRGAEVLRRLTPLDLQPVDRGQEDQHHQRDLEIRVDQPDAPREAEVPAGVEQQPHRAEEHEERERQRDPAELGENARDGQVQPAHHAVRVPRRHGIGQDRAEHGPQHRREQAQLERADEVTAHQRVAELADVGERPRAVRVLERVDHHDPGRPQQEDPDVGEERDGTDPGRSGRPAPGPRRPGAGLSCRSDGHVPSLADGLRPVRRQVIRGVGGLGRAEERWRHGDRGQLRGRAGVDGCR